MRVCMRKAINENVVLVAGAFDNEQEANAKGVAVGAKNKEGINIDAIVRVQEDEYGNRKVVILKETLKKFGFTLELE